MTTEVVQATENRWVVVTSPLSVALFLIANLLIHHDYPVARAEVVVLCMALFAPTLIIGAIQLLHPALKVMLSALVVTLGLVIQLDLTATNAAAVMLLVALCGYLIRSRLCTLIAVFFATMAIVGVLTGSANSISNNNVVPADETLPVYIHVVLDGHIGPDEIPSDVPGGEQLEKDLGLFYQRYGFWLSNSAYSRYSTTNNSLLNLYNFTAGDFNYVSPGLIRIGFTQEIDRPEYFRILRDSGYALRVLHPQYLDYCGSTMDWISSCTRYPNMNLQSVQSVSLSALEKAELMLHVLIRQSRILTRFYQTTHGLLGWQELQAEKIPANNGLQIQNMINDISQHARGYAHIVHLLSPHEPFIRDPMCRYQPARSNSEVSAMDDDVMVSLADGQATVTRGSNTAATREVRYQRYFDNVRCSMLWLGQLFDTLSEKGLYDDAVIIIHGDHGSRISQLAPVATWEHQLTLDDYRDTFSTIFAVKGAEMSTQSSRWPLEILLGEVVQGLFDVQIETEDSGSFVYLLTADESLQLRRIDEPWLTDERSQ